ncbi:hypothetical protein BV22DRAFT_1132915 [Leucogyrophana mollusca]|uniref:Uncharacterized protein n=1 Tax=Leucogyrophana mollusca TaxID=85980 RepID=A0ACB8B512_9AGAM|nr:hypothetical protein BV22DRAFT_1132915 [Leucogyrophana mollusca]
MPPHCPPELVEVRVVYGDPALQTTFKINNDITVSELKSCGIVEIGNTLVAHSGLKIEIDPSSVDVHPDASDRTRLRYLEGPLTMVVWPKPSDPNGNTSSPIIDMLERTSSELTKLKSEKAAQSMVEKSRLSNEGQRQRNIPPTMCFMVLDGWMYHLHVAPDVDESSRSLAARVEEIEQRLRDQEQEIQMLKQENQKQNQEIDELHEKLRETTEADRDAINKIRQRMLLDLGRDKLAVICGSPDWAHWKKSSSGNREEMMASASRTLRTSDQISGYWKALADDDKALRLLMLSS